MILTERQQEFIKERTRLRMGYFRDRNSVPVSVRTYTCECGHTEEYLLFGECPKCLKPIKIRGLKYTYGNYHILSDEVGIDYYSLVNATSGNKPFYDSWLIKILDMLSISDKEFFNA